MPFRVAVYAMATPYASAVSVPYALAFVLVAKEGLRIAIAPDGRADPS